ncbi:hypothetical protein CL614_08580 [archaeon]|nr:hypothetical protein [archaeon]
MSIELIKPPDRFVSLHSHSTFSTFDGLGYPSDHIDFVLTESQGMDAWALTDHGNGNGLAHAHSHAAKMQKAGRKFRQIHGVEFYFVPSLDQWSDDYAAHKQSIKDAKTAAAAEKKSKEKIDIDADDESGGLVIEDEDESKKVDILKDEWKRRYHLVVTAKNRKGLNNLFTLVKKSYKHGFYRFPRIDFKMLKEHGEGLHVTTACLHPKVILQTTAGSLSIKEVVERFNMGEELHVLSYNEYTNKIEFKKIIWGDKTRKNAKLLRLKDKEGNEVKLTPDHRVLVKDKGWIDAKNIVKGDKIISINL